MLKVITDVQHAADRGEVSLLCMLDLSAAFDTVDYCTLRLQQSLGVQRPALYPGLSSSFVIDPRLSAVLQVSCRSEFRSFLTCGVPQGSVLEPVLFLVYCADVIAIAGRCGLGSWNTLLCR